MTDSPATGQPDTSRGAERPLEVPMEAPPPGFAGDPPQALAPSIQGPVPASLQPPQSIPLQLQRSDAVVEEAPEPVRLRETIGFPIAPPAPIADAPTPARPEGRSFVSRLNLARVGRGTLWLARQLISWPSPEVKATIRIIAEECALHAIALVLILGMFVAAESIQHYLAPDKSFCGLVPLSMMLDLFEFAFLTVILSSLVIQIWQRLRHVD